MSGYKLEYDEVVIMKDSNAYVNNTKVTVILTNQNIIQVSIKKGFFGGNKETVKYPLLDLKEINGKPNLLIGESQNGDKQLELFFYGYKKAFSFHGFRAEKKWAGAIEKAYKEAVKEAKKAEKTSINVGDILSPLIDTLESAKSAITPKPKAKPAKIIMVKCPQCGDELTGEKGKKVKCSYCDTIITLQ